MMIKEVFLKNKCLSLLEMWIIVAVAVSQTVAARQTAGNVHIWLIHVFWGKSCILLL